VPTTAEAMATPDNGYKVASMFSGAGGSCLGYKIAGFDIVYACEFIDAAADSYEANFDLEVDRRNVREVTAESLLRRAGLRKGELDLLDGSPPCDPFSLSGNREKKWGQVKNYVDGKRQRTDDLTHEFVKLLRDVQPKILVMENVKGLVIGKAKGYFLEILDALKSAGYRVSCRILDSQWLGVPQRRQRTIFVGVRKDLNVDPSHPTPIVERPVSIQEACPWIKRVVVDTQGSFPVRRLPASKPMDTITTVTRSHAVMWLKGVCLDEWQNARRGQSSEKRFNLTRCDERQSAPTLTPQVGTGLASATHPWEPRCFTVLEGKRLCSFPDDYVLTGSHAQQWQRLGQSVPPLMMRAVAEHVKAEILDRIHGRGKWSG